jgi:putative ABC transport system permease protein
LAKPDFTTYETWQEMLTSPNRKESTMVIENIKGYFEKSKVSHHYFLQPLNDIHLHSDLKDELKPNSRAEYVILVMIVGLLILAASGFNYIQFSFSRLIHSAKKTGIRKINGASHSSIVLSSQAESFVYSFMALVVSLAVAWMLSPFCKTSLAFC